MTGINSDPSVGFPDANTVGSISSEFVLEFALFGFHPTSCDPGITSIDWGCAVQITAAAAIGSGGEYSATNAQTLYVSDPSVLCSFSRATSAIFVALVITHGAVCCFGTKVLARLQNLYVALNVL